MGHHRHDHDGHDHHASRHHHNHAPATPAEIPRLIWALIGTTILMVVEILGGWWSGSLALLADAGHMLMDVIALGIALIAARIKANPGQRFPSGTGGVETFASFVNCLLLAGLVTLISLEARERLADPQPIRSDLMLGVAIAGFVVNALILRYLGHIREASINIRAALLHVAGDLLGSVAVILGAISLAIWQIWAVDAWVSLVVALLIIYSGSQIFIESVAILIRQVPPETTERVRAILTADQCVKDYHQLSIYPLGASRFALSVHLVVSCPNANARDSLRRELEQQLERQGFMHGEITIQFENHDTAPATPHQYFH